MNPTHFVSDLRSGIVVFLVALPLCLGISLACGAPLFSGIISGIVGGSLVALLSASSFSVSGPAAGLTAIVITSVAQLGSFQLFLAAVIMAGLLQIALGLLRTGRISNFIPSTVIKGMLAGIGIILIIKQLPHFVGYDADPEGDLYFDQPDGHNSLSDLYYMFYSMSPGAIVAGALCLCALLLAEKQVYKAHRLWSFIPGPLLAVILGGLLNRLFSGHALLNINTQHTVSLPHIRSFTDLGNAFIAPDYALLASSRFWGIVATLAAVASIETLLNLEAIEKLDPHHQAINPNRELVAQGVGNVASGLLGGLPITSVIVRSSANIAAGAKTKLSAILHAFLLLSSVLLFPGLLRWIPNAALAAVLIVTGYKLTKLSLFKELFRAGWGQFLPFATTIIVMLLTDLLKGVGAGIAMAIIFIIRDNIRLSFETFEESINGRFSYLIKLPQHITFFNKGFIIRYLQAVKSDSLVIIDGSINKTTDKDVSEVLSSFYKMAPQKNIEIQLVKYII